MSTPPELLTTETPMADHIQHFWNALAEKNVRILVDMRRDHEDGSFHWDSSSFGDDVAKALLQACRHAQQTSMPDEEAMRRLSANELACYRWPEDTAEHRALRKAYMDGAAILPAQCAPQPSGEKVDIFSAEDAWHSLVEKDDRTSPEDYPEMCLITFEELRDYMQRSITAVPDIASANALDAAYYDGFERGKVAVSCAAREALATAFLMGKGFTRKDISEIREGRVGKGAYGARSVWLTAYDHVGVLLPAAGGEASKREADLREALEEAAQRLEARGHFFGRDQAREAIAASLRKDG